MAHYKDIKTPITMTMRVKSDKFTLSTVTRPEEWHAYHAITKRIVFEKLLAKLKTLVYNENHPHYANPHHFHFLLRNNADIVGLAQLERLTDGRAALRRVAIDEAFQNRGYGSILMTMLERWARRQQGITVIHIHAHPSALAFYRNQGYREVPFVGDKALIPELVDMAKTLDLA